MRHRRSAGRSSQPRNGGGMLGWLARCKGCRRGGKRRIDEEADEEIGEKHARLGICNSGGSAKC